jgi:hypothetical protein
MGKKQLIRLTEGDLHRIIKETVNNILKYHNHNSSASQNSIDQDYDYEGELWDEETGWHGYVVQRYSDGKYNIEDEDTEQLVSKDWFDRILEYDQEYPRMAVLVNGKKGVFDYRTMKLNFF